VRHKHVIGLVVLAFAGVVAPAGASADATSTSKCVTALSGGDIGERFCVDEPDCLVAEYRTTFLGTERYCLVPRPTGTSTTSSSTTAATRCVTTGGPSFGSKYCVSTENSCAVYEYRWGGVEGTYTCYVSRP
jgi:hypothetical protein